MGNVILRFLKQHFARFFFLRERKFRKCKRNVTIDFFISSNGVKYTARITPTNWKGILQEDLGKLLEYI